MLPTTEEKVKRYLLELAEHFKGEDNVKGLAEVTELLEELGVYYEKRLQAAWIKAQSGRVEDLKEALDTRK